MAVLGVETYRSEDDLKPSYKLKQTVAKSWLTLKGPILYTIIKLHVIKL